MKILYTLPLKLFGLITRLPQIIIGGCLLFIIALALACGAALYLAGRASAQTLPPPEPLDVLLLIDNSPSMYEKDGWGSDPDFLRIEAARLFITYLGIDSRLSHRLGVIFFGGTAEVAVPLTPLTDDSQRAAIASGIADPPPLAWTNPYTALTLAQHTFTAISAPASQQAIVLLTDGKPELSDTPTEQEKAQTIEQLSEMAAHFASQDIPLFIILLQNENTEADPDIEQRYIPLWQEMAARTETGRFYQARQSTDLLDIYHDIVVSLTHRQTAGMILTSQIQNQQVEAVTVAPNLAQVTFVIRKSDPSLQITIQQPDGQPLSPTAPDIQTSGQPGQSLEEIWVISQPDPGLWQVHFSGQGDVTIWQDFYPLEFTPETVASLPTEPASIPQAVASLPTVPASIPQAVAGLPTVPLLEIGLGDDLPKPSSPTPTPTPFPPAPPLPSPTRTPVVAIAQVPSPPTPANLSLLDDYLFDLEAPVSTLKILGWISLPVMILVLLTVWTALGQDRPQFHPKRRSQQRLTGVLRLVTPKTPLTPRESNASRPLGGIEGGHLPHRLDLDQLNRQTLMLGPQAGAYLHLPDQPEAPTPTIHLVAHMETDGFPSVNVVPEKDPYTSISAQVNNMPLHHEWTLRDGDIITLGAYRFKYENLQQRRQPQPAWGEGVLRV